MKLRPHLALLALACISVSLHAQEYLGQLSANPYAPESTGNPYGQYGSPYAPNSVNNPYGPYGSPYSPTSVHNPYATETPRIIAPDGNLSRACQREPLRP
jgi:hypothetical protein